MRNYTYKDSGIVWMGEIPEHWDFKRLFGVCEFVRGNSSFQKNELLSKGKYVALHYGKTYKTEEINEQFQFYVNDKFYKSSQIANYGDVIFVSTSETVEDLGHSVFYNRNDIGLIGGEQILLKPSKNVLDGKYLFYSSRVFGKELKKFATGMKVFRFDVYDLKTIYTPTPPLQEQKAIAEYLDKSTAKLDRIIAIKQEQLLKMEESLKSKIIESITKGLNPNVKFKDTGEAIIGFIPSHWKVKRIKDVTSIVGRIGFRGYKTTDLVQEGEGAITLSPSNIKGYSLVFKKNTYLSWFKYDESPEIKIYNGDIIFVKTGSSFGKVGLIDNLPEKATINPQLVVFKDLRINNKYLFYCLYSEIIQSQVNSSILGGTIPTLSQSKLGRCRLTVPPIKEQTEIVNYLNQLENKTFKTISNIKSQIETLKAYRKSLIHECVTGKKQITIVIKN
jgi:type I restriction enzyme S subunit